MLHVLQANTVDLANLVKQTVQHLRLRIAQQVTIVQRVHRVVLNSLVSLVLITPIKASLTFQFVLHAIKATSAQKGQLPNKDVDQDHYVPILDKVDHRIH